MWEYKIESVDYFDYQDESKRLEFLNELGKEGWELVRMDEQDEIRFVFWLKRLK